MSANAGESSFQNTCNPAVCGTWDSLNHDSNEWSNVLDKYILAYRMNKKIHFYVNIYVGISYQTRTVSWRLKTCYSK
jgi:hypothetical protein